MDRKQVFARKQEAAHRSVHVWLTITTPLDEIHGHKFTRQKIHLKDATEFAQIEDVVEPVAR